MKRGIIPLLAGLLVLSLLTISCGQDAIEEETATEEKTAVANEDEVAEKEDERQTETIIEEGLEIKTLPDGTKYIVEPAKITGGGPPKDGIPSIDDPKFVSVEEADEWIQDNELVLVVDYKGEVRVYPLQIMVWHEIVNEVIAGDPLLITY